MRTARAQGRRYLPPAVLSASHSRIYQCVFSIQHALHIDQLRALPNIALLIIKANWYPFAKFRWWLAGRKILLVLMLQVAREESLHWP